MQTKLKWGHIFWGLAFIAAAVALAASKLGVLTYQINGWTLFLTAVLAAFIIKCLVYLDMTGTVFGLAFLSILYAKQLGIEKLGTWTILGLAVLISIGLSMIINPLKHRLFPNRDKNYGKRIIINSSPNDGHEVKPDIQTDHESKVEINSKMSSTVRYVQTNNFQQADIHVSMGEAKVYFDQAEIIDEPAHINLSGSMGDIELFIPKAWNTIVQLDTFITDVSEKGEHATQDGPIVYITGAFKIGDVTINYL